MNICQRERGRQRGGSEETRGALPEGGYYVRVYGHRRVDELRTEIEKIEVMMAA